MFFWYVVFCICKICLINNKMGYLSEYNPLRKNIHFKVK